MPQSTLGSNSIQNRAISNHQGNVVRTSVRDSNGRIITNSENSHIPRTSFNSAKGGHVTGMSFISKKIGQSSTLGTQQIGGRVISSGNTGNTVMSGIQRIQSGGSVGPLKVGDGVHTGVRSSSSRVYGGNDSSRVVAGTNLSSDQNPGSRVHVSNTQSVGTTRVVDGRVVFAGNLNQTSQSYIRDGSYRTGQVQHSPTQTLGSTNVKYGNTATTHVENSHIRYPQARPTTITSNIQGTGYSSVGDGYSHEYGVSPVKPISYDEYLTRFGGQQTDDIHPKLVASMNEPDVEKSFFLGDKGGFVNDFLDGEVEQPIDSLFDDANDKFVSPVKDREYPKERIKPLKKEKVVTKKTEVVKAKADGGDGGVLIMAGAMIGILLLIIIYLLFWN